MATDLTVLLVDKPGSLADLGETLGAAGINIIGMCGLTVGGKGEIHVLVDDAAKAREALQAKGIEVGAERDVLVVDVQPVPGELGRKARALADAGVNIELSYLTENGRLVFGVDNLEKAKSAL
ncbi:MAG: ACT domain-containing protein [Anaerolineales bacterium]